MRQFVTLSVALLALAGISQAANLIQNGDFESDTNIGTDYFSGTEASLGTWTATYTPSNLDDPRAAGANPQAWNRTLLTDNHVMEHFKWGLNMAQYVRTDSTAGSSWDVAYDYLKDFGSQFQVRIYGLNTLPAAGWQSAAGYQSSATMLWNSDDPNLDGNTADSLMTVTAGTANHISATFTDPTGFTYYQWRITASDGYNGATMDTSVAPQQWFDNVVFQAHEAVALHPGDANGDNKVSVGDLGILAANYGTTSGATWAMADFNGDGAVSVGDLGILAANYGFGAIPEPATLSLLGLGVLGLIRRRP